TDAQLDSYVEANGLDRSLPERYVSWLGGFVAGDWGVSPVTSRSVAEDVIPRFRNTLLLALVSLAISLPVAAGLGLAMAKRQGRWPDTLLLIATVVVAAMPEFVVGIGLISVLAVSLGWLPVDSTGLAFGDASDQILAYVLPALTLAAGVVPYVARLARASASETLAAPYSRAAVLRGLSPRRVVWNYGMRNSAGPLVNAVAINLVYLLSGVIVVENVFAFPGIGQTLITAIGQSDTSSVLAITMLLGAMCIVLSLIADLVVIAFNPRLKAAA
ncbi:MAG TPA: ABC transporter permease, partial [Solirubrobacteraceae bacterium]|nr:ABC transporter permease [Solirubrobacteraceae bacterium]